MIDKNNYKFDNSVLAERISRILQEAIMEGKIKIGEQLVEVEYQKLFESSRTPIREAFRKLENLGIVEIVPRKGAFVKSLTAKDVEEMFPIRAYLEGLSAKYAYANRNSSFLTELELKTDRMQHAFSNGDILMFWKEHNDFHEIVIEKSNNHKLQEILLSLRTQIIWMHVTYKYFLEDLSRSLKSHSEILKMFQDDNTDVNQLDFYFRSHIENAKDSFLNFIREK